MGAGGGRSSGTPSSKILLIANHQAGKQAICGKKVHYSQLEVDTHDSRSSGVSSTQKDRLPRSPSIKKLQRTNSFVNEMLQAE